MHSFQSSVSLPFTSLSCCSPKAAPTTSPARQYRAWSRHPLRIAVAQAHPSPPYQSPVTPTVSSSTSAADVRTVSEPMTLFEKIWRSAEVTPDPPSIVLSNGLGGERGLVAGHAGIGKNDVVISLPMRHAIAVPVAAANSESTLGFLDSDSSPSREEILHPKPEQRSTARTVAGEDGVVNAEALEEWDQLMSAFQVLAPEMSTGGIPGGEEGVGLDFGREAAVRLAVRLIQELQKEGSLWRIYLPLLPKSYDSGLLWSAAELDVLHWDAAKLAALEKQERLELMTTAVALSLAGNDAIPRGFARWALLVVLTRSFTAHWNGVPVQVLVPLADMINHGAPSSSGSVGGCSTQNRSLERMTGTDDPSSTTSPEPQCGEPEEGAPWAIREASDSSPARFEIRALSDVAPGKEVTISYGPYSSVDLLLNYGFVPNHNPFDRLPVYNDLQEMMDDARSRVRLLQIKLELLLRMHPSAGPFFLLPGGDANGLYGCLLILYAQDGEELTALERTWAELPQTRHSDASLFVGAVSLLALGEDGLGTTRALARAHIVRRCEELRKELAVTPAEEDAYGLAQATDAVGVATHGLLKEARVGMGSSRGKLACELRGALQAMLSEAIEHYL